MPRHAAQAQEPTSKIVVEEAAAINHDMLSGGTSLLQDNWNICMTNAAATRSKTFANYCLFYTYGALLADPDFGANNTQEQLATEKNVSLGINLLFQIMGLSQDDGWKYLLAEKPLFISELSKDSKIGLGARSPVAAMPPAVPPQDDVVSIPLTSENGIFTVPATINDVLNINFLVDSGASNVNIPFDVFLTLYRTGTISQADFVGTQRSILADGTVIPTEIFVIRKLQVGDKVARNVIASIGGQNSTLLLGESFLEQFSSWSIDNQNHVLYLK